MNILLTCAGRRNYLIEYLRAVAGVRRVVGADMDPYAPALQECDVGYRVPVVSDPGYVEVIARICRSEEIDLLLSLNDYEPPVLARQRALIESVGTRLLLSDVSVIDTCLDKLACARWLERNGFDTARTLDSVADARAALRDGTLRFPLVVKPRWGSASKLVHEVHSLDELEQAFHLVSARWRRDAAMRCVLGVAADAPSTIIQQTLRGAEFGLDVLNDFDGVPRCVYAKEKQGMRGGETDRSCLRDSPVLEALGMRLGRALGHVGNLDCDAFFDGERASILELNPRFGGGYPFSHAAGADFPAALVAWAQGRPFDVGVFGRRHDQVFAKTDRVLRATRALEPSSVPEALASGSTW